MVKNILANLVIIFQNSLIPIILVFFLSNLSSDKKLWLESYFLILAISSPIYAFTTFELGKFMSYNNGINLDRAYTIRIIGLVLSSLITFSACTLSSINTEEKTVIYLIFAIIAYRNFTFLLEHLKIYFERNENIYKALFYNTLLIFSFFIAIFIFITNNFTVEYSILVTSLVLSLPILIYFKSNFILYKRRVLINLNLIYVGVSSAIVGLTINIPIYLSFLFEKGEIITLFGVYLMLSKFGTFYSFTLFQSFLIKNIDLKKFSSLNIKFRNISQILANIIIFYSFYFINSNFKLIEIKLDIMIIFLMVILSSVNNINYSYQAQLILQNGKKTFLSNLIHLCITSVTLYLFYFFEFMNEYLLFFILILAISIKKEVNKYFLINNL